MQQKYLSITHLFIKGLFLFPLISIYFLCIRCISSFPPLFFSFRHQSSRGSVKNQQYFHLRITQTMLSDILKSECFPLNQMLVALYMSTFILHLIISSDYLANHIFLHCPLQYNAPQF